MSRSASLLLSALLGAACLDPAAAQAPAKVPAQPPSLRELGSATVGKWKVMWIGNDFMVEHCRMVQLMDDGGLRPGAPKLMFIANDKSIILRVGAAEFAFNKRMRLEVTITSADGKARKLLGASSAPQIADIDLGAEGAQVAALLASRYLDVQVNAKLVNANKPDAKQVVAKTVRVALDGAAEVKPKYDECMAGIGKPAPRWSSQDIDRLIGKIGKGTAKCAADPKNPNTTVCDVD